ncbi:MAG: HigA family addiction module antitoxin [bacterium]
MSNRVIPKRYEAPIAISPGFTIREMLDDLNMTQSDLALRMGRPEQAISEIAQGKKAITAETASELESVLGNSQQYWLNREANFQAAKDRIRQENTIARDTERLSAFPYKELVDRGFVHEANRQSNAGKREQVLSLRKFLRVADFDALDRYVNKYAIASRLANTTPLSTEKLAVWLRLGEIQAENEDWQASTFKKTLLEKSLSELRNLSMEKDINQLMIKLRTIGEKAGVVFLFVREFKGFPTKGMTVWKNQQPFIMLTLHGKRWDMLWFTLFHEIGHILLHDRKIFIEGKGIQTVGPEEEKANEFARDTLIPLEQYMQFCSDGRFSVQSIIDFAEEQGVDPSIVVGRLMYEGRVRNDNPNLQKLFRRVSWIS